MAFLNQIFNKATWAQFIDNPKKVFQTNCKDKVSEGDIVLIQNTETREIVGLARLGKFPEGQTLHERFLLDSDVYQAENSKFNRKYEIAIEKVVTFAPISYADFAFLFDINNSIVNNISRGTPFSNKRLYYKSDDEEKVLKKIKIWAESLLS